MVAKMKKSIILFCIITTLLTSISYAGTLEEIIGKWQILEKQRQQREPVEIELQGNKNRGMGQKIYIYITSVIKEKEKDPKKPKN